MFARFDPSSELAETMEARDDEAERDGSAALTTLLDGLPRPRLVVISFKNGEGVSGRELCMVEMEGDEIGMLDFAINSAYRFTEGLFRCER